MEESTVILGGLGLFAWLPMLLTIAAIADVVRTGSSWYWIFIALMFPVVGSLAYFVVTYGPWQGASAAVAASPAAARRAQAKRRLRELSVQLSHWRGPALLVEAGEELLVLGRHAEAERHLAEARAAGSPAAEVSYPLAQAYQMLGRWADSVPLLAERVRAEPDAKLGQVQLALARALDESGQAADAERELRDLLARRGLIEAQVRLARLLLRRGESGEAQQLLREVREGAKLLPAYLRREHRPWIWAARTLRSGTSSLPGPRVEGGLRRGERLRLAVLALIALLVILGGCWALGGMS